MDSMLFSILLALVLMALIFATLPLWMPKLVNWLEKKEKHS
ncbi:hypothetical protein [Persephonella sp.]|nr:hypothetical protein [Persephonella sp.]